MFGIRIIHAGYSGFLLYGKLLGIFRVRAAKQANLANGLGSFFYDIGKSSAVIIRWKKGKIIKDG